MAPDLSSPHTMPPRTRSARVVGIASTPDRKTMARPPSQTVTIPGTSRPTIRRSAKDVVSGLSAYLVRSPIDTTSPGAISVSLKRNGRLVGATLKGHRCPIVDMEFLPGAPGDVRDVYTLGSCDEDGVVFLWFLEVVRDAAEVAVALKVVRKYSFYSLRKRKEAHYSRIRLAGTTARGNMVLVPNDGSNVRVISFGCDVREDPNAVPAIMPPPVAPTDMRTEEHASAVPMLEGNSATNNTRRASEDAYDEDPPRDVETAPLAPAGHHGAAAAALGVGAGVGVAAAGVGAAAATAGPRVDSVSSLGRASSKDRYDAAVNGLDQQTGEAVFASDSSESSMVDGDDVEQYLEESTGEAESSDLEEEDEDEEELDDDYGADEVVDDVEDTTDAESVEFKDARGKPQAHMAV